MAPGYRRAAAFFATVQAEIGAIAPLFAEAKYNEPYLQSKEGASFGARTSMRRASDTMAALVRGAGFEEFGDFNRKAGGDQG